ncbi:VirB4 family type IV secretion system protein (plasmid) [Niallia taxi]|uniref:VirB4 family type IV secretion system protein n=1 Tax=Niallia taxi TaxID=2499688 RepID=UPI003F60EB52
MKLKEKQKISLKEQGYDLNFISKIQPKGGIRYGEKYINTGDAHIGCLHVYEFAEDVSALWLVNLMNIENTIATLDLGTANKEEVIKDINRSIGELRDRQDTERRSTDRDDANYELQNLRSFAQSITQGGEVVKVAHCRIFFYDFSLEELEKRMSDTKKELNGMNHKTTIYLFQSKQEWMSLFTSYEQQTKFNDTRPGKPLPSASVGGGIPFHHVSLKDPRGIYLGQTSTGGPFLLDPFYSTQTRRSFNGFVLGKMGFGKSTLMKMLEEGLVAKNAFIRGFDKARDYYELVKSQNGKIIDLSNGGINPLEVFATMTNVQGDQVDELGSFMQHISKVANMIRFLNPQITEIEVTEFKGLLRSFYVYKGLLTPDYQMRPEIIKITGLRPEQYPILSEFSHYLKTSVKYSKPTPERIRTLEMIQIMVDEMVNQYGPLFDGHSRLSNFENEQIVFFDIDGISQLDKPVFNCQLFTALTLIWNHALKNGRKMKHLLEEGKVTYEDLRYFMVLLDECHNIINSNNVFAVEYVVSFEREMRKFSAGVFFATQSPNEILPESASDKSVAIIKTVFELTTYKVFLNLDNSVMGRMKDVLGDSLTDTEYSMLPELKIGQAIIQTSSSESYTVTFDPEHDQLARFKGGQ